MLAASIGVVKRKTEWLIARFDDARRHVSTARQQLTLAFLFGIMAMIFAKKGEAMSNIRPLAQQAIEHWREYLPNLYRKLKAENRLEEEALAAVERTLEEAATLEGQGYPPEAAWEMVSETYLFRPEEPGTSEEAPDSDTYKLMVEYQRILRGLTDE